MACPEWYDEKIEAEKTPPEYYNENEKRIWMDGYSSGRCTVNLEGMKATSEKIHAILDEPQKSFEYVPLWKSVGRAIHSLFKSNKNGTRT